jgi:two-component system, response regulator YesN
MKDVVMIQIVIVDDEPLVVITMRTLIEKLGSDYRINNCCSNGKEALDYITAHPEVDLVITDVDMPVLDGIGLAESLNRQGSSCSLLFLSAYSNFSYVRSAFNFGAADYILKTELDSRKLKAAFDKIADKRKKEISGASDTGYDGIEEKRVSFFHSLLESIAPVSEEKLQEMYETCNFKMQFPFYFMILRPGDVTDVMQRYGSSLPDFNKNICSLLRQCVMPYNGDVTGIDYNLYFCMAQHAEDLENVYDHFYDSAWTYFETGFEKRISRRIESFDIFMKQYKSVVENFLLCSRPVVRAKRYIQEHYQDKELDMQTVANYAGVSKNHLSSLFSKETGETIIEFLSRTKIQAAKKMLMETDCRTFEVADRTGFSNVEVFCRVFKKITGTNPGKIRQ